MTSIRHISLYGFLTLIAGSLLSGALLLYFLFALDDIKLEQQVTEDAYDSLYELKYNTERLLTTYDLPAERKIWNRSKREFEKALLLLRQSHGEQSVEFNRLWGVIVSEMLKIDQQLSNPLFQAGNTMDKSLLRRLGEGLNADEQSDYYISMSRLFNSIEYLKQYEAFLLDELATLRELHKKQVTLKQRQTKQYAIVLPSFIMFLTLIFAFATSRLIGRNETALIATRESLEVSLEEFEHLFNTTLESIFLVEDGHCIDANEKSLEMFGFGSKEEVVGKQLIELIAPESREYVHAMMLLDENNPYEAYAIKSGNVRFPVLCRGHNYESKGRKIRIAALLDLSDLKEKDRMLRQTVLQLEEKQKELIAQQSVLDHQAHYDALTDLPNRVLFLDHLHKAIEKSKANGSKTAILFIDLDRFKEINDSLGHSLGDKVLEIVAGRLKESVHYDDSIARFGGDEFTLLLEEASSLQAMHHVAKKIIDVLQEPMYVLGHELYVTTSIGISIYPDDGDSAGMLLSNADAAMYKAKSEGKNTYQFYTTEMTEQSREHIVMERKLRRGLEAEAFTLFYQPQFDGHSGKIVGTEALLRWPQEDGSIIPPDKFIPLAEDTGLIIPLGEWVLKTACEQVAAWKSGGIETGRMAVNLSGKQLQQEGLYDVMVKILHTAKCRPEWIELEVTEGFIMKDPESSIALLTKLRKFGIEIAIDDFGTGHSSMTYLKRLPIHTLKIDRSFISELPENREDMAISRAIIALAKGLGLKLIAEGVETQDQKTFMLEEGCSVIQGYLYSKPVPSGDIEAMV